MTVVRGDCGRGSDGSRIAAVSTVSPSATPASTAACASRLPQRTTGSTPVISVASAGTRAACRPTSVSSAAASSTPWPSPPSQSGTVSDSSPAWPSFCHKGQSQGSSRAGASARSSTPAAARVTAR